MVTGGGLPGLAAGAAEFGVGAIPAAFVGGDLALLAGEEFGGRGMERWYDYFDGEN
jgi:hypothetical protein